MSLEELANQKVDKKAKQEALEKDYVQRVVA